MNYMKKFIYNLYKLDFVVGGMWIKIKIAD
jgi:hypothetical protein